MLTSIFTFFVTKPSRVFALVLFLAAASLTGLGVWKYLSAVNELKELKLVNITLEEDNRQLKATNKANAKFIEEAKLDIELKEKLMSDFRVQKSRDDKKMNEMSQKIQAYSEVDDGPIAKVLKDTLIFIQKDREERAK